MLNGGNPVRKRVILFTDRDFLAMSEDHSQMTSQNSLRLKSLDVEVAIRRFKKENTVSDSPQ